MDISVERNRTVHQVSSDHLWCVNILLIISKLDSVTLFHWMPDFSRDACRPWIEHYASDPNPTLLIVTMGTHIRDQQVYEYKFGQFVDNLQAINRPADIVMFRTTVPGHDNCAAHHRPVTNENELQPPTSYQWKNFVSYNNYTKEKWSNLSQQHTNWLLLDVYPMTILRPDGHRLPKRNIDCLHYRNPGPIDWQNNLAFSNLADISPSMQNVGAT